ncbi:MAG: hypothetical protein FJY98_01710 [Candidatus Liptonbacteria bacterium]|nr:hypothetical protein [Candidatus Pacearchaeota archaeon]MBM3257025.1 hypothetical protein [Candidatus Liptonbacteria bacterium]
MVAKKTKKKEAGKVNADKSDDEGMSLDDAFGDDEDVEYAPASKPAKVKKKTVDEDDMDDMDDMVEDAVNVIEKMNHNGPSEPPKVSASRPVSKIKKGDKIKIDGVELEVDAHYVLMDHGSTKEMTIEVFDKNDKEYQIRYFDDQVESTMEVYELQEIMYIKKPVKNISW